MQDSTRQVTIGIDGGLHPAVDGQHLSEENATQHNNNNNNNNMIIIAFKGSIRDFFTISSQRRELSLTRTLKWPGHVQHIERLSCASVVLRATWYEGTAQLLSLTELKSHLFELHFVG